MKIAVQIYNQRAIFCTDTMFPFCSYFRRASFSSCRRSLEVLHGRSPPLPSSSSHSRGLGLQNARLPCPLVDPTSRLMSSRPRGSENLREVISSTDKKGLMVARAEYELYKAEGEVELPSQINEKKWLELSRRQSPLERKEYLRYLYRTEIKAMKNRERYLETVNFAIEKRKKVKEELKTEEGLLSYGLWRNSMFMKRSRQYLDKANSYRLINAKLYGQPIVFDYDFDEHMILRGKKVLGRQISECIGVNRSHREPFSIHMCNFRQEDETARLTLGKIPTLLSDHYLVDVHSKDYMDVFPKEKLVYLTPYCNQEMGHFDHDAVYVIGGIVDKRGSEPFTLAKAKRQDITVRKLPLRTYLDWDYDDENLQLNQVFKILLEMKTSGSWKHAFTKRLPQGKLRREQEDDAASTKEKWRGPRDKPKVPGRPARSYFKY